MPQKKMIDNLSPIRLSKPQSKLGSRFWLLIRSCSHALFVKGLNKGGQAAAEYLIVVLAFLIVVTTLGVLGSRIQEGLFVEHAIDSASHSSGPNTMGAIGDVLLY